MNNLLKTSGKVLFCLVIYSEIKLKETDEENPSYYNQRDSTFIFIKVQQIKLYTRSMQGIQLHTRHI